MLLLDEPTNHLDLAGIEWLESAAAKRAVRLRGGEPRPLLPGERGHRNGGTEPGYPDGLLRVQGNYSEFLEKKEEFLHAQAKRQEALENRVHNEIEWLRRGAKARTTKVEGAHR